MPSPTASAPASSPASATRATPSAPTLLPPGSNTVTIVTGDTTPPSAPTDVAASIIAGPGVRVSWTAAHDNAAIHHYTVLRDGTPIGNTTGNTTATVIPGTHQLETATTAPNNMVRTMVAISPHQCSAVYIPPAGKAIVVTEITYDLGNGSTRYSCKVWRSDKPEPSAWTLEADIPHWTGETGTHPGSVVLVAHNTDTTFASATIAPVGG